MDLLLCLPHYSKYMQVQHDDLSIYVRGLPLPIIQRPLWLNQQPLACDAVQLKRVT